MLNKWDSVHKSMSRDLNDGNTNFDEWYKLKNLTFKSVHLKKLRMHTNKRNFYYNNRSTHRATELKLLATQ